MKNVLVLTGAGQIGLAIVRSIGSGMKIVVSDKSAANAASAALLLNNAGFDAVEHSCDISSKESVAELIKFSKELGPITAFVNAAGVSPSQASIETILKVDLYGTAMLIEEIGKVIEAQTASESPFPVNPDTECRRSGKKKIDSSPQRL